MATAQVTDVGMCQVRCINSGDVTRATSQLEQPETYVRLAELFGALADPTRAKIVHTLLRQELCTCDIAAVVGISESGVSQHLRVLRGLRLVKYRRAGKLVYYSLEDAHIALLVQVGLVHQGHGERSTLPALAAAAERQYADGR